MYMSSKRAQHLLAPFYRLCRLLMRWVEEPGNVLAALGLTLGLCVLLSSSFGHDEERYLAVSSGASTTQSEFWTLHDAALMDDPGASTDVTQCAPAADNAATPDCADSAPDDGAMQFAPMYPTVSLQPFGRSWQPRVVDADIRAITAP